MGRPYLNNTRIIKILLIFSFFLLFFALIVLETSSQLSHYELSIYSSIPLFWILIASSTSITIATAIYQLCTKNYHNFWLSFFCILLNDFIIFSVPYFRGYYLYGSNDVFAHLEYTRFIILHGNIGSNYYPITHILGAEETEIWSIPPEITFKFLPVIFTMLFIVFICFLAIVVSSRKEHVAISAVAGAIPIFSYYHVAVYPHTLSLFLFPLGFYLYFKVQKTKELGYIVALIILLVLIPYTHAITSIVFICCLGAAEVGKIIWKRRVSKLSERITFNFFLISLITFFMWWSSFAIFGMGLQRINNWLFAEGSKIPRANEIMSVFQLGQEKWIELLIKNYGPQLIYIVLSLVALAMVIYALKQKKIEMRDLFIVSILFLTSTLVYSLLFLTTGAMTIGRFFGSNVGAWVTPILAAYTLFVMQKTKRKDIIAMFIAITLIFSFFLGILSVYRSPWTLQPNWQATYKDASGIEWYDEHGDKITTIVMACPIGSVASIPPNFGYSDHEMLGESLSEDSILLFGEYRQRLASENPNLLNSPIMDIWAYPNFKENDFNRLRLDESVNLLYTNEEFNVLFIKSIVGSGNENRTHS